MVGLQRCFSYSYIEADFDKHLSGFEILGFSIFPPPLGMQQSLQLEDIMRDWSNLRRQGDPKTVG